MSILYSDCVPFDFHLFWPNPVHAHINVPIDFRFSIYEKDNQPLFWQLTGAPAWMSIDQFGRVSGTPTVRDVAGVTVTITVSRLVGNPLSISRSFIVRVYNSDAPDNDTKIRFVSLTGNDINVGSLSSPWRHVQYSRSRALTTIGQTVYVRGGTYQEDSRYENPGGLIEPMNSKYFSAADPFELRGYPGEVAIFEPLNGANTFSGIFFFYTTFNIVSHLIVRNSNTGEGGNFVLYSHDCVVKDCESYGSDFPFATNCTGVLVAGHSNLVDRTPSHDNYTRSVYPTGFIQEGPRLSFNNSNYEFYGDKAGPGTDAPGTAPFFNFILNSKGWNSVCNMRVKHSTPSVAKQTSFVVHNAEAFSCDFAFDLLCKNSSLRYAVAHNCQRGLTAYSISFSDEAGQHGEQGPILVEHLTLANVVAAGIDFSGSIFSLRNDGSIYSRNIIYTSLGSPEVSGVLANRTFNFWRGNSYAASIAVDIEVDYNVYWNTSGSDTKMGVIGDTVASDQNLASWRVLGHDMHGKFQDPLLLNAPLKDFSIPVNSPANYGAGDYAGAFRPGVNYGAIGAATPQLIEFQVALGIPPAPPPPFGMSASGRRRTCGCMSLE